MALRTQSLCTLTLPLPSNLSSPDTPSGSSDDEDATLLEIPRGPVASPQHVSRVWTWWDKEISPWRSIVLGKHNAHQFDASSPLDRWSYAKYRFDFHHHYKEQPPPPIEMWREGILCLESDAARQWFHRRDMQESYEGMNDSD